MKPRSKMSKSSGFWSSKSLVLRKPEVYGAACHWLHSQLGGSPTRWHRERSGSVQPEHCHGRLGLGPWSQQKAIWFLRCPRCLGFFGWISKGNGVSLFCDFFCFGFPISGVQQRVRFKKTWFSRWFSHPKFGEHTTSPQNALRLEVPLLWSLREL